MIAMPTLDATDHKLAFKQFDEWLAVHGDAMTTDQRKAAEYVRLSYDMIRVSESLVVQERWIKFLADDLAKLEVALAVPPGRTDRRPVNAETETWWGPTMDRVPPKIGSGSIPCQDASTRERPRMSRADRPERRPQAIALMGRKQAT